MKSWSDFGIEIRPGATGNVRANCPQCEPTRKHKNRRPLSVDVEAGIWYCHHCSWSGTLKDGQTERSSTGWWDDPYKPKEYRRPVRVERPESDPAKEARRAWADRMKVRGITGDVLKANGVDVRLQWMPQTEREEWTLAYPYERDGELVNVKYRDADKNFRMEKAAEKILWRLDKIASDEIDTVIFTEGENDALALEVAGFLNATSVPSGAPSEETKTYDSYFSFLEDSRTDAILSRKKRFILAVDSDRPGMKLRDELARRFGADRCLMVDWPDGCKDANDVLVTHGVSGLQRCIERARPYPLEGVLRVEQFRDQMDDIYQHGFPPGPVTGWAGVDGLYRPAGGLVTIVTGAPGSGKSRWVNALAINQAMIHDTRIGICSPEYQPTELLTKHLAETYVGKPMHDGAHDTRMTSREYQMAMDWVDEHVNFIVPETTSVDEILSKASSLITRYGIRMLIIDPWTEVEMPAGNGNEVRILQESLARIQRFARMHRIHVIIVVHPVKQQKMTGSQDFPVIDVYDLAGGAQWFNKSDFIISVWRSRENRETIDVDINVQKARFQHLGRMGSVTLQFDWMTGRYTESSRYGEPGGSWEQVL